MILSYAVKKYLIEETKEVITAINKNNQTDLKEELGDLLLQIVLHSQIAKENNHFDINDVIKLLIKKLKRRHPHVFGKIKVNSVKDIRDN